MARTFPWALKSTKANRSSIASGTLSSRTRPSAFFPPTPMSASIWILRATPSDFLDARTSGGKKGHPSDPAYWENMFAVCHFDKKKLKEIKIFPIDQGFGRPRPQRGRPLLAEGEVANRVIERVTRLSQTLRHEGFKPRMGSVSSSFEQVAEWRYPNSSGYSSNETWRNSVLASPLILALIAPKRARRSPPGSPMRTFRLAAGKPVHCHGTLRRS